MSQMRLMFAGHLFLATLILLPVIWGAGNIPLCPPSYCGNVKISYPFRLKTDPIICGEPNYELACEDNQPVFSAASLNESTRLFIQSIDYSSRTIQFTRNRIHSDLCSSFPSTSFTLAKIIWPSYAYLPSWRMYFPFQFMDEPRVILFVSCASQVESRLYVDASSCHNARVYSNSSFPARPFRYAVVGKVASDLPDHSCTIDVGAMTSAPETGAAPSLQTMYTELAYGFELSWNLISCKECNGSYCQFDENFNFKRCPYDTPSVWTLLVWTLANAAEVIAMYLVARCFLCSPFVAWFLIYKVRRRRQIFDDVEEYLQGHNNLSPIRYSYSEMKSITRNFREKLGEGAHGCVYKGRLRSGRDVAVKILEQPKANGREFINEIGTIGRIHHINVVQLIGFCAQGSKRAIVYDFMPNGSLEKYIFSEPGQSNDINCESMFEICLGIARGIEYLHRGCDVRILHFDIKPHNILLDHNFIPKISDFGLAKLYPTNDSIVPLTAARGTVGYMAPELFYNNIGGVSYKADVYSFGMLLMEMVGRRKNWNELTEHSSQNFFPLWVYDQISRGENVEISAASEDEITLAKKMLNVALWCIQVNPRQRPSMSKVVEMLEGNIDDLEIPPRPFLCTEYRPVADDQHNMNHSELKDITADSYSVSLMIDS